MVSRRIEKRLLAAAACVVFTQHPDGFSVAADRATRFLGSSSSIAEGTSAAGAQAGGGAFQNIFYGAGTGHGRAWTAGSCGTARWDHQSPVNFDKRFRTLPPTADFALSLPPLPNQARLNWTGSELELQLPSGGGLGLPPSAAQAAPAGATSLKAAGKRAGGTAATYPGFVFLNDVLYHPEKILFRTYSEHTLYGKRYPLEAQLLFSHNDTRSNTTKSLGIVVFFDVAGTSPGEQAGDGTSFDESAQFQRKDSSAQDYDAEFQKIIANFPWPADAHVPRFAAKNLDLEKAFSLQNATYLAYVGSATSPSEGDRACAEDRVWLIQRETGVLPVPVAPPAPVAPAAVSATAGVLGAGRGPRAFPPPKPAPKIVAAYQLQNLANTIRFLNGKSYNNRALMPFGEHRRVQVMRSLSRGEMEARGMITTAGNGTSGGGKGKEVVNMNAIILGLGGKRDPAYHLMPWGKAPRTDAEVRAVKAATKAKKIAKKVTKYIKDIRTAHYEAAKAYQDAIVEATAL